ncbi:hypothetical protein [uncultured Paraglaciecola sp.]|uniref:hypothetical protein n=1 Tax=uncultured Paraglaciecola sp. TaxID=1765024 RepID=UPI002616CC61|nr:hypothetical protein [uncultured Paraglaciecola sp.]
MKSLAIAISVIAQLIIYALLWMVILVIPGVVGDAVLLMAVCAAVAYAASAHYNPPKHA